MGVQEAVADESGRLSSLPAAERNARHHNVERTRKFLDLTHAVRGRFEEHLIVVHIPFPMLVE